MTGAEVALLLAAGLGAGLIGSIAGLASLVSYPALLLVGLGPVAANVTNTVALVGSGVGAVLGSRPELRGQGPRLRRLVPVGLAGGAGGAALLLLTPAAAFERLVPVLIAAASLAVLVPWRAPLARAAAAGALPRDPPALLAGCFGAGLYAGYFGAAAGVVLLAVLLATTRDTLARGNATKNVVLGVANAVAAVVFAVLGPVDWLAALPLAAGFLVGGRVGPVLVRLAPPRPLRAGIGLAGLALAVRLAVDAYG